MKEHSWIQAHIHLMEFLGGSARLLVSDNLRTGIISHQKHEDPFAKLRNRKFFDLYEMNQAI